MSRVRGMGTSLIRNRALLKLHSRTLPLGPYGSPSGGAVSHERGNPVHTRQRLE